MRTTIYYLCKSDGVPFYIGKTNKITWRKNSHKYTYGNDTILEIIDEVLINEWKFWETHYISLFKSWGFILKNKNNGGGGLTNITFSDERNKAVSVANIGRLFTDEHKNNISKSNMGISKNKGILREKYIGLKISKSNMGRKHSDEHKNKISQALTGIKRSQQTKDKISISSTGKVKTQEHKSNISKKLLGNTNKNKIVDQYTLDGIFIKEWISVTEAKKYINGDIYACCTGKQNQAGGFIWKYKISYLNLNNIENILNHKL
jgi:hypothetical protein